MSDHRRSPLPAVPPPTALPDFLANLPKTESSSQRRSGPAPLSFAPPRPPVLNPELPGVAPPATQNPFKPVQRAEIVAAPSPKVPVAPKTLKQPKLSERAAQPVTPNPTPETDVAPLSPPPPVQPDLQSPAVLPTSEDHHVDKVITPSPSPAIAAVATKKEIGDDRVDMTGGLMSWFTKTVTESKLLSDVAEKAKHGMEQVLTTLDPGMKGFLSADGVVELHIPTSDASVIKAVKDGFERVFASVLVKSVPAAKSTLPPLVAGSAVALKMCEERLEKLTQSKLVPAAAAILVIQPFVMDIEGRCFTASRLLLHWKGHSMDSIGQMLEVPDTVMEVVKRRSDADGKPDGQFSVSISQAVKEMTNEDTESWAGPHPPYSFAELLSAAASSVALQYMNLSMSVTSEKSGDPK